ncbi:MAG: hypothetical protein CMM65_00035 [Rhodospirillaceae bacterium]|jgi:hypothetical protein|nr:hypothetical protein [Rhodospirillaceae bacterium]|tara:strand:+ start:9688 stop:10503 length:816 start_codon:yes stop_codon:yes gene_type:complete
MQNLFRSAIAQPIFQFFIIAAVLYTAIYMSGKLSGDEYNVNISDKVTNDLYSRYKSEYGLAPDEVTFRAYLDDWMQEEILFREAKAMGLDIGDDMIRERLVRKFKDVLLGEISTGGWDEEDLQNWFNENSSLFDVPPLFDIEEIALNKSTYQAQFESIVSNEYKAVDLKTRKFYGRSPANINQLFGKDAINTLENHDEGGWVLIKNAESLHAVRITKIVASQKSNFEDVRVRASQIYQDQLMREQLNVRLSDIAAKYEISFPEQLIPTQRD